MTIELKNKMIKEGRIILTGPFEILQNYLFAITFAAFSLVVLLSRLKFGEIGWGHMIFVAAIWFFVTASYLIQRAGLKLEKETLMLEKNELFQAIDNVAKTQDWHVVEVTEDWIIADSSRLFRASNRITLLIDGNDVYFNARTTGPEMSFFQQGRLTEEIRSALRMRYFEIQHQKTINNNHKN